jgi:VIT family
MGLGAWLAAITDRKQFQVEEKKQRRAIRAKPAVAEEELYDLFHEYDLDRMTVTPMIDRLVQNFDMWIKVCCMSTSSPRYCKHSILPHSNLASLFHDVSAHNYYYGL